MTSQHDNTATKFGGPQAHAEALASTTTSPQIPSIKIDPLADNAKQQRPGILNRTLRDNGITLLRSCLRIPYYKPFEGVGPRKEIRDGHGPFYRDRLLGNLGSKPKYFQPPNTTPHAYFPKGVFEQINETGLLIITEGEFKALALAEASYPAVGIGGIHNFAVGDNLVPELEYLFTQTRPTTIAFLGDADTSLIPQFASAALKLHALVAGKSPDCTFVLPRMPLAELECMKGIDDAREQLKQGFNQYFKDLLTEAIELQLDTSAEDLGLQLIEREKDGLKKLVREVPDEKLKILKRLTRVASACGPARGEEIAEMAVAAGLVKNPSIFRKEEKRQAAKDASTQSTTSRRVESEVFYYPKGSKNYFYKAHSGAYTCVDRRGALNFLVQNGFTRRNKVGEELSESEARLTLVESQPIEWAGTIAGKKAGIHFVAQKRVLVTDSPRLLKPTQGEYPVIKAFLAGLFDYDPSQDSESVKQAKDTTIQSPVFLSWLALAIKDLYNHGQFCPAQALVLAGPQRVGKNVCQDIITECLGGRQTSPYAYMQGSTGFNGNLIGAEHWMIADENESAKSSDKLKFKSFIKKFCVNSSLLFNAKFSEAINLDPYRRVTISLNNDAESLQVLPDLSENAGDKMIILRAFRRPFYGCGTAFAEFKTWHETVKKELPFLIWDLLNNFQVPSHLCDPDYRVRSFHNPELIEALQSTKTETDFSEVVLNHLPPAPPGGQRWRGTARTLIGMLRECGAPEVYSEGRYSSSYHVGRYLNALSFTKPELFHRVGIINGIATYEIGRSCDQQCPSPPPPTDHPPHMSLIEQPRRLPPPPPPV